MNYFYEALRFENLYKAMKQCCRNVRWKDSVAGYEANGIRNTLQLKEDVLNGKYKISPYQKFYVYEPKKRLIIATRLRDRQLQRAMCNAGLYQELTKSFILDNVACQTGKGTDFMVHRMKIHMERYFRKYQNNGWVLKCDIHKFFPSTSHEVAKTTVAKRVTDKKVCQLVFDIIDSFDGYTGIGLGSQISQLIELAVLDDLDHFIKEQLHIKFYIRYMDDFILVHPDKDYLRFCLSEIKKKLSDIKLELNNKTTIYPIKQGIKFCQWRFCYKDTGKIVMKMNKAKLKKQRRKIKAILRKESCGLVPEGSALESTTAWLANAKRGDTYADRKEIIEFLEVQNALYQKQTDP